MTVHLYVEGGGDTKSLKIECREGFSTFLERAGLRGKMPRIVACGSRQRTFDRFCTALRQGSKPSMMLVDSEDPVCTVSPWQHLRDRDKWERPLGATEEACHLMVQCMESWLLADRASLASFFGQGFQHAKLPAVERTIESLLKKDVYECLRDATQNCKTKAAYGKGIHSFKLLKCVDPASVVNSSHWAARLVATLSE